MKQLIIDIPEEVYNHIKEDYDGDDVIYLAVKRGTPCKLTRGNGYDAVELDSLEKKCDELLQQLIEEIAQEENTNED